MMQNSEAITYRDNIMIQNSEVITYRDNIMTQNSYKTVLQGSSLQSISSNTCLLPHRYGKILFRDWPPLHILQIIPSDSEHILYCCQATYMSTNILKYAQGNQSVSSDSIYILTLIIHLIDDQCLNIDYTIHLIDDLCLNID